MFEIVHTVTDWYDGPRRGIAEFHGRPHLFESEWADGQKMESDSFLLSEIDPATLVLALEDGAIWRRWEAAFAQGNTAAETHPALPGGRLRHDELTQLLEGRLVVDPTRAVQMKAEFRVRPAGRSVAPSPEFPCGAVESGFGAELSRRVCVVLGSPFPESRSKRRCIWAPARNGRSAPT